MKMVFRFIYNLIDKFKSVYFRNELFIRGAIVEKDLKIYGKVYVYGGYANLSIGKGCTLNQGVFLGARGGIEIGDYVRISPNAMLISSGLHLNNFPRTHFEKKIVIKDNVWIASGATITAGITIGENSVIGAGSVVTRNVPPDSFYAGIPAKLIKSLKTN